MHRSQSLVSSVSSCSILSSSQVRSDSIQSMSSSTSPVDLNKELWTNIYPCCKSSNLQLIMFLPTPIIIGYLYYNWLWAFLLSLICRCQLSVLSQPMRGPVCHGLANRKLHKTRQQDAVDIYQATWIMAHGPSLGSEVRFAPSNYR